jgi:hypothetical protein
MPTVVFLHGIDGHALRTWTPVDGTTPWIEWLTQELPGIGTATIAYGASKSLFFGEGLSLAEYARLIEPEIDAALRDTRGPVFMVCHSLGGLIVKQLVVMAASGVEGNGFGKLFLDQLKGVAFYSTPHDGSRFGTIADRLRLIVWPTNTVKYLASGNDAVTELATSYRNVVTQSSIPHLVQYETRPTPLGFVVTRSSANPGLPGEAPKAVPGSTHATVCRPRDRGQPSFRRLVEFLRENIDPRLLTGSQAGPVKIQWPIVDDFPIVPLFSVILRLSWTLLFLTVVLRGLWVTMSEDLPDLVVLLTDRGVQMDTAEQVVESIRQQSTADPRGREILENAIAEDGVSLGLLTSGSMEPDRFVEEQLARINDTLARIEQTKGSVDTEVRSFADRAFSEIESGQIDFAESLALMAEFRNRLLEESGAEAVGDRVVFQQEWFRSNISKIAVPQLVRAGLLPEDGQFLFYTKAHHQLAAAFSQVEEEGLLGRITQWCGAYANRTMRGTSIPSVHALGIAFDINCDNLQLGRSIELRNDHELERIVQIFNSYGFAWGGSFASPDPMHFQVYRIIE